MLEENLDEEIICQHLFYSLRFSLIGKWSIGIFFIRYRIGLQNVEVQLVFNMEMITLIKDASIMNVWTLKLMFKNFKIHLVFKC